MVRAWAKPGAIPVVVEVAADHLTLPTAIGINLPDMRRNTNDDSEQELFIERIRANYDTKSIGAIMSRYDQAVSH